MLSHAPVASSPTPEHFCTVNNNLQGVPAGVGERRRAESLDAENRLETLQELGLLDRETEERYDRLTRLASKLLRAPTALVSLVEPDRQFFKSAVGLPANLEESRETPLSHSFCQHVVTEGAPLRIDNAVEHELVRDNLAIPDLGVMSYLGVPLEASGHTLGSFCVFDSHAREWTDEEESVLRAIADSVETEITLRAALTHAEEKTQEAIAASLAKNSFLAHVSHELRTPLNSIIGFSEVLIRNRSGGMTEKDVSFAGRIQKSGTHLLDLINELLDFARIESGKVELKMEEIDVRALISDVADQMEVQARLRNNELVTTIPDGDVKLTADRFRLLQVLTNLVANANKFTERGRVTIEVVARKGRVTAIRVTDNGIGIPADRLKAIFEAFEQADSSTSKKFGGTGLGLTISRTLCEMMEFELKVESEVGVGSVFSVETEEASG